MDAIRVVLNKTSVMRKCSFGLSCLAVIIGSIALFTNHWIQVEEVYSGFLNTCMDGMCQSVQDQIPSDIRAAYVIGVILVVYMPLILLFAAAVIQGVSVFMGPSKRRDLSGTICAWISSYHGILLATMVIAGVKMSDYFARHSQPEPSYEPPNQNMNMWPTSTRMPMDGPVMMESHHESTSYDAAMPAWSVGWSAYVGLLALVIGLASAIISTVYSGSDKPQNDDNIPLESDYA